MSATSAREDSILVARARALRLCRVCKARDRFGSKISRTRRERRPKRRPLLFHLESFALVSEMTHKVEIRSSEAARLFLVLFFDLVLDSLTKMKLHLCERASARRLFCLACLSRRPQANAPAEPEKQTNAAAELGFYWPAHLLLACHMSRPPNGTAGRDSYRRRQQRQQRPVHLPDT